MLLSKPYSRRLASPAGRFAAGWTAWLVPSFGDAVFLICLIAALKAGAAMLSGDGDPARHLVLGEHILATGAIPRHDVFTHPAAGQPILPHEWLAEVASAASFRLAGLAGPVLLHGAAIGLAFAVLLGHLRSRGHAPLLALAVALFAARTSGVHWLVRPHVVTFLGAAVFCALLDGWHTGRERPRRLWALPPVMALWANLHGGFLIGFLVLGAYAGADVVRWLAGDPATAAAARGRLRQLVAPAAATAAATALNPAGPALLTDVTGYLNGALVRDLTLEYMSPDFHQPAFLVFLAMLLATVAAVAWSGRRPSLHEGLLLLGFTYLALYARRGVPLFGIVAAPLLAAQLAAFPQGVQRGGPVGLALERLGTWLARRNRRYGRIDEAARGHAWPALALVGLLWLAAAQKRDGLVPLGVQFDPKLQPVAAAAYLEAHPPAGNGFNEQRWGGYLLHEFWPARRVFIDGELSVHTEWLARDYLRVVGLEPGWEDVLDRYGVQWVLYSTDSPLVRALAAAPGWQVAYQDQLATVLTREP